MLLAPDFPGRQTAEAIAVLIPSVDALSDSELVSHFRCRRGVVNPLLPKCTEPQMANASAVLRGEFSLLGETFSFGNVVPWRANPSRDKEWQIALHKFYFAVDLAHAFRLSGDVAYLERWTALIDSWLDQMGSGFIVASDAQVEAKRLEHWVMAFVILQETDWMSRVSGNFLRRFLRRIAEETQYVSEHLRPARNHRTFQLFAIFLVGVLFPEFIQHRYFVAMARDGLTDNLLTDFGDDGVHIELSSHYHQITLETAVAFVELARLNGVALDPALIKRLHRALEFSLHLTWPDGNIPLINDSDNGDHLDMLSSGGVLMNDARFLWGGTRGASGRPPVERSRFFEASGYYLLRDGWGRDSAGFRAAQHVFYDCGFLGEGSHSHYDLFSFTYFAGGQPLIVDPGRFTYDADPDAQGIDWRYEFKRTAAHNTITIDGWDQTRYLSKSRNAMPGMPRYDRNVHREKHGPSVEVKNRMHVLGARSAWVCAAAHSHEYAPVHSRLFCFMSHQYLVILDRVVVNDGARHMAELRFHLSDRWLGLVALEEDGGRFMASAGSFEVRTFGMPGMRGQIDKGWVSTSYGSKTAAPVLSFCQHSAQSMRFASVIADRKTGVEILWVEPLLDVGTQCGFGLRIAVAVNGVCYEDVILLQEKTGCTFKDSDLRYQGEILMSRRARGGTLIHVSASHPGLLDINGAALFSEPVGGPAEWIATGTH